MAIYRNKKVDNFTVIDNSVLQNKNLSWKAKGLLVYLLSLPSNWDVRLGEIQKHATDGETSLRSAVNELRKANYIIYTKSKNEEGHFQHTHKLNIQEGGLENE